MTTPILTIDIDFLLKHPSKPSIEISPRSYVETIPECLSLLCDHVTYSDAQFIDITETSISVKLKRLGNLNVIDFKGSKEEMALLVEFANTYVELQKQITDDFANAEKITVTLVSMIIQGRIGYAKQLAKLNRSELLNLITTVRIWETPFEAVMEHISPLFSPLF